jgi:hypothetical protein
MRAVVKGKCCVLLCTASQITVLLMYGELYRDVGASSVVWFTSYTLQAWRLKPPG